MPNPTTVEQWQREARANAATAKSERDGTLAALARRNAQTAWAQAELALAREAAR